MVGRSPNKAVINPRSSKSNRLLWLLLPSIAVLSSLSVRGDPQSVMPEIPGAEMAFAQFAGRVVKVEVIEQTTGSKSVIGSGFFVGADGQVVTNYHVISNRVFHPGKYMIQIVLYSGQTWQASILAVDVIHDLALLSTARTPPDSFELHRAHILQGSRIYSMGYPLDIGITIVEGNYNDVVTDNLYDRIHLSAAINSGMSGGPTFTEDGTLVGINVESSGNQVGFLVPQRHLMPLIVNADLLRQGDKEDDVIEQIRKQLHDHQKKVFSDLEMGGNTSQLGPYRVPAKVAPFLKCWGARMEDDNDTYYWRRLDCGVGQSIYVDENFRAGQLRIRHDYLSSRSLGRMRFYRKYGAVYAESVTTLKDNDHHVTNYECETSNVKTDNMTLRVTACLRNYRKLDGLFDLVLRAAALGEPFSGLVSNLEASSISAKTAETLSRRFLEELQCSR